MAGAIDWAVLHLRHLTFHPRALDTARRCPYRWPNRLLDDLRALDDVVATWQKTGALPGGWSAAAAVGLNWARGISDTARNQYRTDYEITLDDGTEAVLGPHLRRGAATGPEGHYRAYLHIDDTTRTVTVGYIGAHLRDGSNP